MKRILRVVAINVLVLTALLTLLELAMRAGGMRPIYSPAGGDAAEKNQYKRICDALRRKERVAAVANFYTDQRGIFRAAAVISLGTDRGGRARINQAGFRGNEFTPCETRKPKILFLGDSFTWGSAAIPLTESFPDLVERSGYYVYNGGIPGTDPQQYALLAESYVPLLEPDVTAVCLYLGNDFRNYAQPLLPNRNLHYVTRLGFIRGYDDRGNYFADGEQAVDYVRKRMCGCSDHLGDTLLYHTVVGKALTGLFHGGNRLKTDPQRKWVVECLERIRRVCRRQRSRLLLFLIPNKKPEKSRKNLKLIESFKGFAFHFPGEFTLAEYAPAPDNHFNNRGHRRFADFILHILEKEGFSPVRE